MYNEFNEDYPDIGLLVPSTKIKSTNKPKKKKSKKEKPKKEKKYSDIDATSPEHKRMLQIADSIEGYLDTVNTYFIFEGVSEEQWKKMKKKVKKLIKKLREGDTSVFNMDVYNEVIESGHSPIVGYNE